MTGITKDNLLKEKYTKKGRSDTAFGFRKEEYLVTDQFFCDAESFEPLKAVAVLLLNII